MMQISLIVATCGRSEELRALLHSLTMQSVSRDTFEIIVIDQNASIDLAPIISPFADRLHIHHIHSHLKGLSRNRNLGIDAASGRILAFPDDDCQYYPDTIETVLKCFDANPASSVFLGMIYDRTTQKQLFRQWQKHSVTVNQWNFYRLISSITLFCRRGTGTFDPRFGVGAEYGSNEDADFVLSAIRNGSIVSYDPAIHVWHPEIIFSSLPREKAKAYGIGFGAFIAKHSILRFGFLLMLSFGFQCTKMMQAVLRFDLREAKIRWASAYSRLLGSYYFVRRNQNS